MEKISTSLPELFEQRLRTIIPSDQAEAVIKSFSLERPLSIRLNTLKASLEEIVQKLKNQNIQFEPVLWNEKALILKNISSQELSQMPLVREGYIYVQALSSMLPVLVLDPQPGEDVLDMCAAPGSKTTQMASLMQNEGTITCVENIKDRFYRLKSVVSLLGVDIVDFKLIDGRRFRSENLFDKILVDAPCSSEGRFRAADKRTFAYWSPRKIKEMVRKQRGLLLNATRLLKSGGTLVYSTCTFAPEENEGVLNWVLKKVKGMIDVVPVDLPEIQSYPAIEEWEGKVFSKEVKHCFRVLPTEMMEGFVIVKMIKR